jgi:hypothetical protein
MSSGIGKMENYSMKRGKYPMIDEPPTKVIFRKFKDNSNIIALFPELPGNSDASTCLSYMTVGQHGAADESVISVTTPATPSDYYLLRAELESLGYNLKVVKNLTYKMYLKRKEQ